MVRGDFIVKRGRRESSLQLFRKKETREKRQQINSILGTRIGILSLDS